MRLSLLVLLITTQCYSVSTEADITRETVYDSPNQRTSRDVSAVSHTDRWRSKDRARFTRDTDEFTLTEQDDLNDLSIEDLKKKLDMAEQHMTATAANETGIQEEFDAAKSASQTANTTLETVQRDLKTASEEKKTLEEPLQIQKKDVKDKEDMLEQMKNLLQSAERKVRFPPKVQDKKAHALNASNSAEQTLHVLRSQISEEEREYTRLSNVKKGIETKRKDIFSKLSSFLGQLRDDGCPEPNFAKKSEAANKRRKRKEDCSNTLKLANASHVELIKADELLAKAGADFQKASDELGEKQRLEQSLTTELTNWQDLVVVFTNVTFAENELERAEKKVSEPKELRAAIFKENKLLEELESAKKAAPRLAAVYTRLEGQLATAREKASEAKRIHSRYQAKYKEKSSTPVDKAGLPWGIIGGVGGVSLIVIILVALLLRHFCCKKKRRGGKKTKTETKTRSMSTSLEEGGDGSKEGGKGAKKGKVKAEKKEVGGGGEKEQKKSDKTESDKAKLDQNKVQKSDEKEEEEIKDPCLVQVNGKLMLDAKLFKYKHVVRCDAYHGDLPHDKADEVVKELPKVYMFEPGRLFYAHPELDKPIVTGLKPPTPIDSTEKTCLSTFTALFRRGDPKAGKKYIESEFFQPEHLSGVSDETIVAWFMVDKKFDITVNEAGIPDIVDKESNCVPRPEEYIVIMNDMLHKKDPAKHPIKSKPKLDKAKVRSEFLDYFHMMAAVPCKDDDATSRINMDLTHIMWICSNARETLIEHHTSQLHEFSGSVVVVGDMHGQFADLVRWFATRATKEKPGWLTNNYIFLGDYVDRGVFSLETIMFLFLLKILYPKNIKLLRGNHEDYMYNSSYGFARELNQRYPQCVMHENFNYIWRTINGVFVHLPMSALLNRNVYFSHGGFPREAVEEDIDLVDLINQIPMPYMQNVTGYVEPKHERARSLAFQIMWMDPALLAKGFGEGLIRGNNPWFGPDVFAMFKKKHRIVLMIRGHQMTANGISYPINERSLILTFGGPNYDKTKKNRASTIDIDVNGKMGVVICGRWAKIKTEMQAMDMFRKFHPFEKNMDGEYIYDDPTLKILRDNKDSKKGSKKPSGEKKKPSGEKKKPSGEKKVNKKEKKVKDELLPEKTAEDEEDKVKDKDIKTDRTLLEKTAEDDGGKLEDKDKKTDKSLLVNTTQEEENQVEENKVGDREKIAEAPPGKEDGSSNIPPS